VSRVQACWSQLVLSVATQFWWQKIWFSHDKFLKLYNCSHKKNMQSNHIYVSVRKVGLSHVRARQCTSTPILQNSCVFGSRDAWFHVPMLLSAYTMNILHQWTRLSLSSKKGNNWHHQLRQTSLYSWHIMMSPLRPDWQRIFNQLPYFVEIFWISISSATTGKNFV